MDNWQCVAKYHKKHYIDVIMTTMASQITSLAVVYSSVYLDADQRKHQSSASLAFVWGIDRDRWIPHTKGQLRGKCFHLMTSSWITTAIQEAITVLQFFGAIYIQCVFVMVKHLAVSDNIIYMMTSSNGNIFRVTGPLCWEFTSRRWIPHTKASDAQLWCFLWSAPEWTVE